MLTEEQTTQLVNYYETVNFTPEQKGEIIRLYWLAGEEERREISKIYRHLFANDSVFIQRLIQYKDGMTQKGKSDPQEGTEHTDKPTTTAPRVSHSQRLLRSSIADQFPVLQREEYRSLHFPLQFELVTSEAQRREVIELYSSQFISPDPPELMRLVPLSHTFSTRTRRQVQGHYSFLIRLLNAPTMEAGDPTTAPPAVPSTPSKHSTKVVCAVTINAHCHSSTPYKFIDMPLFATAAGYKKNGFAKLLNAALCEWASRQIGAEFIVVSADEEAVEFWRHLGYRTMTKGELKKIEFYYEHECNKFIGATPMVMYCNRFTDREHNPQHNNNTTTGEDGESATTSTAGRERKYLSQHSVLAVLKELKRFTMTNTELPSP